MTKKIAYAYVRVSSEGQADNTSLQNQKSMIIGYALNYGFDVTEVFMDVDSGDKEERTGLISLRKKIQEKSFDAVICAKIDRFTRDVVLGETVRREIEACGGKLISVTESIDSSTPTGLLFLQMLQIFSSYEKAQILWRFASGKKRTVTTRGKWIGGTAPIGYTATGTRERPAQGHISTNEDESKIVQLVFKLRQEGKSIPQICNLLNERGYKTRQRVTRKGKTVGGVNFHTAGIFRILKRKTVYLGLDAINSGFILENGVKAAQPKII